MDNIVFKTAPAWRGLLKTSRQLLLVHSCRCTSCGSTIDDYHGAALFPTCCFCSSNCWVDLEESLVEIFSFLGWDERGRSLGGGGRSLVSGNTLLTDGANLVTQQFIRSFEALKVRPTKSLCQLGRIAVWKLLTRLRNTFDLYYQLGERGHSLYLMSSGKVPESNWQSNCIQLYN